MYTNQATMDIPWVWESWTNQLWDSPRLRPELFANEPWEQLRRWTRPAVGETQRDEIRISWNGGVLDFEVETFSNFSIWHKYISIYRCIYIYICYTIICLFIRHIFLYKYDYYLPKKVRVEVQTFHEWFELFLWQQACSLGAEKSSWKRHCQVTHTWSFFIISFWQIF